MFLRPSPSHRLRRQPLAWVALTCAYLSAQASPSAGASAMARGHPPLPSAAAAAPAPAARGPLVDINSASLAELKTLPGIGDAEARRIIAARPYPSKYKLLADKVLSEPQFDPIRHRLVAVQKGRASAMPKGAAPVTASPNPRS